MSQKDHAIQEKEKLYVDLRKVLARQPGPEAAEQIRIFALTLKEKKTKFEVRKGGRSRSVFPQTEKIVIFCCCCWFCWFFRFFHRSMSSRKARVGYGACVSVSVSLIICARFIYGSHCASRCCWFVCCLQAMTAELKMYQAKVYEYKYEIEKLNKDLELVKLSYFAQRRQQATQQLRQQQSSALSAMGYGTTPQPHGTGSAMGLSGQSTGVEGFGSANMQPMDSRSLAHAAAAAIAAAEAATSHAAARAAEQQQQQQSV